MNLQIILPLILTLLAGMSTLLGGFMTFFVKRDSFKALSIGLGFSAGVMIFLSLTDILPEAQALLIKHFPNKADWLIFFGFIAGIVLAMIIDYFLPDHVDPEELKDPDAPCTHHHKIKRAGLLTAIAICVHNFPEGMATFLTATQNLTLGISVAIAIAIHNIPEGIAVALPIYHVTGKKRYAMLYAALSGISEPIGALIGMILFTLFIPQMLIGILLAAVAGIMIYIAFDTLLPLSNEYGDWHLSMTGIVTGILFIWLSLIILGHHF